jgi:hypothetical protein
MGLIGTAPNTGYKTRFSLLVISRKEKRKLIKGIQVLVENPEKILVSRVLIFSAFRYSSAGLSSHLSTSRDFLARASRNLFQTLVHTLREPDFSANPVRAGHVPNLQSRKCKDCNAGVQKAVRRSFVSEGRSTLKTGTSSV